MFRAKLNLKINNTYLELIYIFFLGSISSFSLPPYSFWFLNFITFSLLIIFLLKKKKSSLKEFFIYGYIFGFGYFVFSMYWIPLSLSYDESFKSLIPLVTILIPALLSLFYAISFCVFKKFSNSKFVFSNILLFSLVLGFFEYLRGNILSGFPWNLFSYSFSENLTFIQINSLIGVYAFNTILITIFSVPSILYLNRDKINLFGFLIIFITGISFYYYGELRIKNFNNLNSTALPSEIKIISTNLPIERFYSSLDSEAVILKLIRLSDPKLDKKTLFIWPESVIPNINLKSLNEEYNYLFGNSFGKDHFIILGINDTEIINGKQIYYNSLSIIDKNIDVIYKYYKNNLVPFGEFLPLENLFSKIGFKSLTNNYHSYSEGSQRKIFNLSLNNEIRILPIICYEIIYSGTFSKNNNYNFIVNISEDGWFGNSIGPHQHFAHTIFRSIEYGKYTLRSANNGISAIIDPTGKAIKKIKINDEGALILKKIKNINKTAFSEFGNKIYFLVILLYIFLIFSFKSFENE